MRKLAILRPEPGATATLAKAGALGLDAFALPLFEVVAVEWEAPEPSAYDGVLLTSANAVRLGGEGLQALRGLPAYAVGEATADAAREWGFGIAATGDHGVDRLLGSVDPGLRLFHPCGRHRTAPSAAPQKITPAAVYEARAIARVAGLERLGGCVALVHSQRAGRRLAELVGDRWTIAIAAISSGAASAAGSGWEAVVAAETPAERALLALAARLCKNGAGQ